MFCKNCGKEIPDKAEICLYCGAEYVVKETTIEEGQMRCPKCGFIGAPIAIPIFNVIDWVICFLSLPLGGFGIAYMIVIYLLRRKKAHSLCCSVCNEILVENAVTNKEKDGFEKAKGTAKNLAENKELRRTLIKGAKNIKRSASDLHNTMYLD